MDEDMSEEDREQFEANRDDLIDVARKAYSLELRIGEGDVVEIEGGRLADFYEFYQDYRSEIEEAI